MSWAMLGAVALPYLVNAFQPRPKAPQASPVAPMPDRSQYINQILNQGFDKDPTAYRLASEQAQEQINRMIANQGLTGSSIGLQAANSLQAELALKYMQDQQGRMNNALSTVLNYDTGQYSQNRDASNANYQMAMDDYNRRVAGNAGLMQGIGAIGSTAAGIYSQNQRDTQLRTDRQNEMDRFYSMMNDYKNPPAPAYGVPGGAPPAAPPMPGMNYYRGY